MIELPEATIIAQQMDQTLRGKAVAQGNRGNAVHKFAFSNDTPEAYTAIFHGKKIGAVTSHGSAILAAIEPGYVLVLGGGGERILFHESEKSIPKKHHLWLQFTDGTYFTVTVQGWGNTLLLSPDKADAHPHVKRHRISPLNDAFTEAHFQQLFEDLDPKGKTSLKYFLITEPGVWGIGNGCLQDILFNARLHPRKRAVETTVAERSRLYTTLRETLTQMIAQGGRDSERDLFNHRGGYTRLLYSKSVGQPCPNCGTPIEKQQYLGGAIYFCPTCQM